MPLSILPSRVDITVEAGTDNTIEFTLLDANTGLPVDLTLDSVKFTAKKSGTLKIGPKTNGTGDHEDADSGRTRFKLTRTELTPTISGKPETWQYEVRRVVGGSNDEIVYLHGSLILDPSL